jgi:hypothetical protein
METHKKKANDGLTTILCFRYRAIGSSDCAAVVATKLRAASLFLREAASSGAASHPE